MSQDDDARLRWYDEVADALGGKPPDEVAHELPGLVDHVADDDAEADHFVVGVSFTKSYGCLDYAVDRVVRHDGEPVVESVKPPASENHRYVHFSHPPDPHFDDAALRARLLGAVLRERQAAADAEPPTSTFADIWKEL